MTPDVSNELVSVSDELARLLNKPLAAPRALPHNAVMHPELAAVVTTGALALDRLGVDPDRMAEFTQNARRRGLRKKALVFGWHPRGHTWYATPESGAEARVLVIDRREQLATQEMSVDAFVQQLIEQTRTAIARVHEPEPEPEPEAPQADEPAAPARKKPGPRRAKVELLDSRGATVTADGKAVKLDATELGYIRWCLRELQLASDGPAPDLSRWTHRALRTSRLDAVPTKKGADLDRYRETWLHLTEGDRTAPGPVSHQLAGYKLTEPGTWILAPSELALLRRADKATPPRHAHDAHQKKIWAKWIGLVKADRVELEIA